MHVAFKKSGHVALNAEYPKIYRQARLSTSGCAVTFLGSGALGAGGTAQLIIRCRMEI